MSSRSPSYERDRHRHGHRRRSRSRSPRQKEHRHGHGHRHKHSDKETKTLKTEKRRGYPDERPESPVDRRHDLDRQQNHRHRVVKQEQDVRHRPMKQEREDGGHHRSAEGSHRNHERERRKHDRRRVEHHESDDQDWGRSSQESKPAPEKDKPNFGLSGKLTEDTNTYKGVVIKYNEPVEARKPLRKWRLYPFKGEQSLPMLPIHRQSAFLFGRDRRVADIPVDHPSCSKQHAVFQYRLVPYKTEGGRKGHQVKPYIIDLGSANGTFVNNKPIDSQRYVELLEKDVLKFGFSSREYVLLHDNVDVSQEDSD